MIIKYSRRTNPEAYETGVDDTVCTIHDGVRSVTSQLNENGDRYIYMPYSEMQTLRTQCFP